jgi:hypothetical protein
MVLDVLDLTLAINLEMDDLVATVINLVLDITIRENRECDWELVSRMDGPAVAVMSLGHHA